MKNEPRCTIDCEGTKRWFLGNKIHRKDGPAVEYKSGVKCWYINDKCHREDGPAIVSSTGVNFWYADGRKLDPIKAVNYIKLKRKYPKLIESMEVYLAVKLVHNS
jgi:hypothetical protein